LDELWLSGVVLAKFNQIIFPLLFLFHLLLCNPLS
jgi:hypothetical protein